VKELHPREAKAALAEELTARYHGPDAGRSAREEFDRVFSQKDLPSDLEEFVVPAPEMGLVELLVAASLVSSKNEARRLIEQGGVRIDNEKVQEDRKILISKPLILQAGKRKFKKILRNT
jgi:tyrosyl-tRNA synthetase